MMDEAGIDRTTVTLSAALDRAARLLIENPALAETQLQSILNAVPGQQQALFLLAGARRASGDLAGARALLENHANANPGLASVQYELGLILSAMGERDGAIGALSRAVALEPGHLAAWRALGQERARNADKAGAGAAFARHVVGIVEELKLLEGAIALADDQLAMAENMLRQFLGVHPTDVSMLHMLGGVLMRLRRFAEAEAVLARALELAPDFSAAQRAHQAALDATRISH